MKKVIIASENPVKVQVARNAFSACFPDEEFEFVAVKSESGVPDQPMNEQTRKGAENRLIFIREKYPSADYYISQEGGLFEEGERMYNRAWIMVSDHDGFVGESSTSHFYIPKGVVEHVKNGLELGDADDKFFGTVNSKQGMGGIGQITDGVLNRTEYYTQAAIVALSCVKHKEWYL